MHQEHKVPDIFSFPNTVNARSPETNTRTDSKKKKKQLLVAFLAKVILQYYQRWWIQQQDACQKLLVALHWVCFQLLHPIFHGYPFHSRCGQLSLCWMPLACWNPWSSAEEGTSQCKIFIVCDHLQPQHLHSHIVATPFVIPWILFWFDGWGLLQWACTNSVSFYCWWWYTW